MGTHPDTGLVVIVLARIDKRIFFRYQNAGSSKRERGETAASYFAGKHPIKFNQSINHSKCFK